jgi:hypothetical protein
MSPELKKLVTQWKQERTYRDAGVAADRTWARIKEIATPEEQIKLLREKKPRC